MKQMPFPNIGRVIVKPDPHWEETLTGAVIPRHGEMQRHFNVYGEVVAVPDKLFFQEIPEELLPSDEQEWFAKINPYAAMYDTPIEIEVGDRVAFRYSAHFFGHAFGDHLVIPYDLLTIRMKDKYPLNGYVIFKIPRKEERYIVNAKDNNDYGKGELIAQGALVGYANGGRDEEMIQQNFLYERKGASRLELDIHNTFLPDNDSSVFLTHRKKIACSWT